MKVERLTASLEAVDELFGFDAVCAFLTEEERPFSGGLGFLDWRLCGAVSRVVKSGFFEGVPGEKLLLPTDGRVPAGRVFVVGLGKRAAVTAMGLEHALQAAAEMLLKAGVESVALAFPRLAPTLEPARDEALGRAFFGSSFKGRVGLFDA
jgi:hypothetical protein